MNEDVTNHVVRRHRPILGILGVRRSTKIEPQPNTSSDDSIANESQMQSDEQVLLEHKHKKVLERNNTFPRLNASLDPKDELELPSNNTNRYSICCSTVTTANGMVNSDSGIEGATSNEEEAPSTPSLNVPSSARPLAVTSSPAQYNLPSYESYPSPILLSCRSRFRDKFLPPSSDQYSSLKDHSSTPDIPTHSAPVRQDSRKSGSFDTIAMASGKQNDGSADTGSRTDSLAKQALMAAHLFHLIPTEKARQRNFLQGRSASNSLLGAVELEKACPNRDVTIFIGSWNMNG